MGDYDPAPEILKAKGVNILGSSGFVVHKINYISVL